MSANIMRSHLDMLMQPDFPFEGFNALRDAELVGSFCGEVARVPVVVVYRKSLKQLAVGFSGTANIKQTLYDLYPVKQGHSTEQGSAVHSGFWMMYEGLRKGTFEHVQRGLRKHNVQELANGFDLRT